MNRKELLKLSAQYIKFVEWDASSILMKNGNPLRAGIAL
jgi:hypothetical protein